MPGCFEFVAGEFVGEKLHTLVSNLAVDGIPVAVKCRGSCSIVRHITGG